MNNIELTFEEFNIPLLSEDELTSYQKEFPNILWKRNNHLKPNVLINEYSKTITIHDEDDTNINSVDLFFHPNNHDELSSLMNDLLAQINKLRSQSLDVIENLINERTRRLGQIRFIDGISIGEEVKSIVGEIRYLEKCAIAIRYQIVEKEIKVQDLEYISAELLSMEMASIL
ncbi:hypothetical protein ACO0SA_000517 [Hanseniaspora valbyensis]